MMTALVFSSIFDDSGEHFTKDNSTIVKSFTDFALLKVSS
jgi:hypothetical protein